MRKPAKSKATVAKAITKAKAAKKKPKAGPKAARPGSSRKAPTKRAASGAVRRAGGARRASPKAAPRSAVARRADFGAPIDDFFAKQPPELRAILEALRKLVEGAAPDATASLKWGIPVYTIGNVMMCALGGHKSHVNLVLAGPPGAFVDPGGKLTGSGKTGRHLTIRRLDELPQAAVRGWLRTASYFARAKA
jgi:hypothetical protein